MTAQQINKAIDQEIWKIRDNEEAMRKMLDAARQIRIMYVTPHILDEYENEQQQLEKQAVLGNTLEERILALDNEPDGFFKMAGILGRCDTPIDKLREDALYDKYGI